MATGPDVELRSPASAQADGLGVPGAYSSLHEEYDALTGAVGLVDRSYVGRLELAGADALDLLNRLSTNKLEELTTGRGMGTVLTSVKGRIVDLLLVLMLDSHLLVITGPETRQKVAEWIDFYIFTEDVTVRDATPDTSMFSMIGPKTETLMDEIAGEGVSSMARHDMTTTSIGGVETIVVRKDLGGLTGFDLVVPSDQGERLWDYLLARGSVSDIRPVGTDALEVVRVEHGVPGQGRELGEDYNPLEAGLLEHISFDKGCYVGQEVIARLDTYQKVSKHLVGLSWDSPKTPAPNASLLIDGRKSGVITSAVRSPRSSGGRGLGYVRKAAAEPGSTLKLDSEDADVEVRVETLPFRL